MFRFGYILSIVAGTETDPGSWTWRVYIRAYGSIIVE